MLIKSATILMGCDINVGAYSTAKLENIIHLPNIVVPLAFKSIKEGVGVGNRDRSLIAHDSRVLSSGSLFKR